MLSSDTPRAVQLLTLRPAGALSGADRAARAGVVVQVVSSKVDEFYVLKTESWCILY